jgi:hypothetical protein
MSKRNFIVFITCGLLAASSAFASRARLAVMGTGDPFAINQRGSLYYDDMNNIFYNPSYANDFKNWAIVEKFNGSSNATTAPVAPNTNTGAEGGFMGTFMNFNVGFYMNREDGIVGGAYFAPATMRPFDLFLASEDMGIKWGLGLSMANFKADATTEDTEVALRLGAQYMDFEPYVNLLLKGDAKTAAGTDKTKDMVLGLRYKYADWTPYTAFRQIKNTTVAAVETKATAWGWGTGHQMKLGESAQLNYGVGLWKFSSLGTSSIRVPVNMSLEGTLTSWLSARAGLSYNLVNQVDGFSSPADGTTGRLGAAMHFNKVDFDWAIGNTNGSAAAALPDAIDGNGFDFASGFFTAASMTYRW